MSTKIISICVFLFLFSCKKEKIVTPEEQLKVFYTEYIILNDKLPESEAKIDLLKKKYISRSVLEEIHKLELDYDPIINAQDVNLEWLELLQVKKADSIFKVCYFDSFSSKENCIKVLLKKEKETYLISKIYIENAEEDQVSEAINPNWYGSYTLHLDYGKIDDTAAAIIGYNLSVNKDSCLFSGMGYQTNFRDYCISKMNKDTLELHYKNTIQGTTYNEKYSPIVKVYKSDSTYFVKSEIISNKESKDNVWIEIEKGK